MNESSAPSPSQQIPGYQLLAKIGKGGMGTVYKARQISLDRIVAIKVLPKRFARDPAYVKQLYAEGKAAAKLNHPHIVGALDVGQTEQDGKPIHYFVMEFVEGNTVYDELMENIRYDEDEALPVMIAIAKALEHAHAAGLIHRDVKPQNMMVTKEGVAKLADMGLARGAGGDADEDATAGDSGKKQVVGSPFYMSPEQIRNQDDIDFRTDLYSLGASFYYMVTGKPVFDEPTVAEVLKAHLTKQPEPAHEKNPQISVGLSQIIRVCLAKNRAERYDKTRHLVEDLEAVESGGLPLHAAGKLDEHDEDLSMVDGLGDDLGEDDTPSEESAPRVAGRDGAGAAASREPVTRHATVLPSRVSITQERSFWIAIAGWLAAAIFAALYFAG